MQSQRALPLRIAQFPLTRLLLLGPVLVLLIGLNNGFRAKFAAMPWVALAVVAVGALLGLGVYAAVVRFIERRPVSELSLSGMGLELAGGTLLGAALYTACVGVLMLLGHARYDGLNPAPALVPLLTMALSAGVLEELLYRGALFRIVEEVLGSWAALAVSALVFGASHLANEHATLLGAVFISAEAGLMLAAAYLLTRRLWFAIGLHMAWNFTQGGIFSGAVSGVDLPPGLVRLTLQGPELFTGGAFGLEASVVAFGMCTTAGVVLLALAIRRGHLRPGYWARPAAD